MKKAPNTLPIASPCFSASSFEKSGRLATKTLRARKTSRTRTMPIAAPLTAGRPFARLDRFTLLLGVELREIGPARDENAQGEEDQQNQDDADRGSIDGRPSLCPIRSVHLASRRRASRNRAGSRRKRSGRGRPAEPGRCRSRLH